MTASTALSVNQPADKEVVDIEKTSFKNGEVLSQERIRHLEHLLLRNHNDYSVLYNNGRFHNHSSHLIGSAYLLGGSVTRLDALYDGIVDRDNLEPWKSSPARIDVSNQFHYIGLKEYQRAWVESFREQLSGADGWPRWREVVADILLRGDAREGGGSATILHGLFADVGHPLIHLGYAFELKSPLLATEALALAATCYNTQLSSLMSSKSSSSLRSTSDLVELFSWVLNDKNLPTFEYPGDDNLPSLLGSETHLKTIKTYLYSWNVPDSPSGFLEAQRLASLALIATSSEVGGQGYDFFLVHLLTTLHAAQIIVSYLPLQHHITLLRPWLLVSLLTYITQNRPRLDSAFVTAYELNGRDWEFVRKQALEGPHASDAHFVKGCYVLMDAARTPSGTDSAEQAWFLKCAGRFASEFDGWAGFRLDGPDAEEVAKQREKDGIHVMGRS
ncbi:hypothetical protein H2200_002992 [Cladophialophora chaetospira]|uniref:Oxidoreductase AflY n=1 Tax=Cladophialophora chaetospira TaxID=386627 RepID=A0AA38XH77_9EURO|nr:hypothetical protein H2200_002992 [Cladophialophora chaetospira]